MSGDGREELREKLIQAMHDARFIYYEDMADALVPTVRAIVADELRAATEVDLSPRESMRSHLRARADALSGLRTGAEGETGVPVTPQDGSGASRANQGEV